MSERVLIGLLQYLARESGAYVGVRSVKRRVRRERRPASAPNPRGARNGSYNR